MPFKISHFVRSIGQTCLLIFLVGTAVHAAEFYVSATGDDSNPGTLTQPFATLGRAQTAASSGDTVWVRGGTYKNFAIAATDRNYNYVHQLNKSGISYAAYPGETPVFDFTGTPTNRRVCGFQITGSALKISGFVVTGVPVGTQKQSECFRITGSAAYIDFYDCIARDNAANGFYFTNGARGSCTRCDSYRNIGTHANSVGNTDGFGAHGLGVVFRYCRAWSNSDDGFDCISSAGANVFDHCWSIFHNGPGDANGFKIGGFGADPKKIPPRPVPVHRVMYCLSVNNTAHGFYANHQPGQSAVWTFNSSYNNSAGDFDMLERRSDMSADVPGFREVLHNNLAYAGPLIKDDANAPDNVTDNSWTMPGATADPTDFVSVDVSQLTAPRGPGGEMPFVSFLHLTPKSDLTGLGCFQRPPEPPQGVRAQWINSGQISVTWAAVLGATRYYVKRASVPGGPYVVIGSRVLSNKFLDTTALVGQAYYYIITAMDDISFDESSPSNEGTALPTRVAINGDSR
jgi:pectate lyase-like protein